MVTDSLVPAVTTRIPCQSPLEGVAEEDVNVIPDSAVPTACKDPSTISSLRSTTFVSVSRSRLRSCPGVRSVATWTGTLARPSFCAAFQRVWPTMITPSASITMGWRKPNSARLAATASTASSLMRGLAS